MGRKTEYVGLLPAFVDAGSIRYFGDKDIGEFLSTSCSAEPSVDGLGDVARHLAQFVSKRNGDTQLVYGVGLQQGAIYHLQGSDGKTNYSVCLTQPKKGVEKPSMLIRRDLECSHEFGILGLYAEEVKPKPDAAAQAK